ncbi:MAG: hypothetical protein AB7G93_18345 [Bdellovibrionales bacterium]
MSMTTTLPAVAKKVFYPCKKCGTDRYQTVVAHTSATAAKMECEVCHTKNTFKVENPNKKNRSAVPRKSTGSRAAAHVARWTEMRDKNAGAPKPYSMKTCFEPGAALDHPKFGLGFVVSVSGQAMQVVFQDEERSLVCNRQ